MMMVLLYVGELIMSNYVAVSINNWLQDVSATKAFISCVQNVLQSVFNWYCYVIAHNQFAYIEECSNELLWHCGFTIYCEIFTVGEWRSYVYKKNVHMVMSTFIVVLAWWINTYIYTIKSICDKVVFVYTPVFAVCVMCCRYDDSLCLMMWFLVDLYFLWCFVHAWSAFPVMCTCLPVHTCNFLMNLCSIG